MHNNNNVYAIDFETFYSDEVSIGTNGVHNYLRDPRTEIYMVSIVGPDGFEWVGHPDAAPWSDIDGEVWVSHNAAFDRDVYAVLGYDQRPSAWHCTANLATALDSGRSLLQASRTLLGVAADKTVRGNMLGKRYCDLPDDDDARKALTLSQIPGEWMGKVPWKKITDKRLAGIPTKIELGEYALDDSRLCYRLWSEHAHRVRPEEIACSDHTTAMVLGGIGIDYAGVAAAHDMVETALFRAKSEIPWCGEEGVKLLSAARLEQELSAHRLPVPSSTNKNDAAFQLWLDAHEDAAPFIRAFANLRSLNKVSKVVGSMLNFSDPTTSRLYYGLKYMGAHTGRFSGSSGLNMQNFPRPDTVAKLGLPVDPRSLLKAPEGKTFVVADYSQIEARVALWSAGAFDQLAPMEGGMDIYEAHARATMGYTLTEPLKTGDPAMRKLAKARVLGLGFGCGAPKFQMLAKIMSGLDLSGEECQTIVGDYRRSNPEIVGEWKRLNAAIRDALADVDHHLRVTLPSDRCLNYYNVRYRHDPFRKQANGLPYRDHVADFSPSVGRGAAGNRIYGGLLFENVVQATARDILRDAILRVEAAGHRVVLHVHDEIIVETDEATADEAAADISRIMCERPAWAQKLPLAVEAGVAVRYTK